MQPTYWHPCALGFGLVAVRPSVSQSASQSVSQSAWKRQLGGSTKGKPGRPADSHVSLAAKPRLPRGTETDHIWQEKKCLRNVHARRLLACLTQTDLESYTQHIESFFRRVMHYCPITCLIHAQAHCFPPLDFGPKNAA